MQTIYIDVLIFINIFIDYFLLMCVKKFLNITVRLRRMLLGSLLGGVFSLTALAPRMNPALNLFLTLVFGAAVVFAAFGQCGGKLFLIRTAAFLFVSVGFCGVMILLQTLLRPGGLVISNGVIYFDISPVLLIIFTVICYFALRLFQRITGKQESGKLVCEVEVTHNAVSYKFKSKVDTGCSLTEPFSGAPVIIVDRSVFSEKLPFKKESLRIIPFGSLGGQGILEGYKPDKVAVNHKPARGEIYLGVCENLLSGEIKSLMNSEIVYN